MEEIDPNALPIHADKIFQAFERFYVRLLSVVMGHYNRPSLRPLQPKTYAFLDYPGTKRRKNRVTLEFRKLLGRLVREYPENTPHIHALMLIHPDFVERFEQKESGLETLFRDLGGINRTLKICELSKPGDDTRVLAYSSELLAKPRHPDLKDVDLFMWLPKAASEPSYQRSLYERELEKALKEDSLFRRGHVKGVIRAD